MKTRNPIQKQIKIGANTRLILAIVLLILSGFSEIIGQESKQEKSFQDAFNAFKTANDQEFKQFRIKIDSAFASFLRNAWIEYDVFANPQPSSSKPTNQPKAAEMSLSPMEIVPKKNSIDHNDQQSNSSKGQTSEDRALDSNFETDFYEWTVPVPQPDGQVQTELQKVNELSISDFYEKTSGSACFESTMHTIHRFSAGKQLSGWAQLQLIQSIAAKQYALTNSKVLFTWIALINEGTLTRVCFTDQDVFLLVPFDTKAYLPYIQADDGELPYYLLLFPGQQYPTAKVRSYDHYKHPTPLTQLSLRIQKLPQLGQSKVTRYLYFKSDTIPCQVDKNLIEFYASYPNCDLTVPFHTPLSTVLQTSLDQYLMPKMMNLNTISKVNLLLEFVQFAIGYQTDDEQFGQENYLFPEETIYFPFADCEDRVSLMMQLVKRYTGLSMIGLSYPNHISMAVSLSGTPKGAFISYLGKSYWVCDPTYLGSTCGMIMPKFKNATPEIIN